MTSNTIFDVIKEYKYDLSLSWYMSKRHKLPYASYAKEEKGYSLIAGEEDISSLSSQEENQSGLEQMMDG